VVVGLFGYVYWSTASYVRTRADRGIVAELAILQRAYDMGGRNALVDAITRRMAEKHLHSPLYLLADSSYAPIARNLDAWPPFLKAIKGWNTFTTQEWNASPA
jgi:hypothetical protein